MRKRSPTRLQAYSKRILSTLFHFLPGFGTVSCHIYIADFNCNSSSQMREEQFPLHLQLYFSILVFDIAFGVRWTDLRFTILSSLSELPCFFLEQQSCIAIISLAPLGIWASKIEIWFFYSFSAFFFFNTWYNFSMNFFILLLIHKLKSAEIVKSAYHRNTLRGYHALTKRNSAHITRDPTSGDWIKD